MKILAQHTLQTYVSMHKALPQTTNDINLQVFNITHLLTSFFIKNAPINCMWKSLIITKFVILGAKTFIFHIIRAFCYLQTSFKKTSQLFEI
jgi:hypothetical protein